MRRFDIGFWVLAAGLLGLTGCGSYGYAPPDLTGGQVRGQLFMHNGEGSILVKSLGSPVAPGSLSSLRARLVPLDSALSAMGWQALAVPAGTENSAMSELQSQPGVVAVEPNYVLRDFSVHPGIPQSYWLPLDDPGLFPAPNSLQYAPQITQAVAAWRTSAGAGQTIAIVDTGVDTGHPDLASRVVSGWNTLANNTKDKDDYGHGTHCAGIAAALASGPQGVMGIAPGARILPVKALDANGSGSDGSVAGGITWAADHGATVINMSLGGPVDSKILEDAVAYALQKGCSIVAAMGNDGNNSKSYPAAIPGVIGVGATDSGDQIASYSQWGSWISISAPGDAIYSTFPTYHVALNDQGFPENYATLDGTSMASPAAAGAVADIRAAFPTLGPEQVKAILESSADKVDGQTGFDPHYGNGRIDVARAVSGS